MKGYPNWFRDLCGKWKPGENTADFYFGPNITTKKNIAPLLLKMSWKQYPVYRLGKHGWGYLVAPGHSDSPLVQVRRRDRRGQNRLQKCNSRNSAGL